MRQPRTTKTFDVTKIVLLVADKSNREFVNLSYSLPLSIDDKEKIIRMLRKIFDADSDLSRYVPLSITELKHTTERRAMSNITFYKNSYLIGKKD